MKITLSFLIVTTLVLGSVGQAHADLLYSDGPINGYKDAWNIQQPNAVSDSFLLQSAANLTSVQVGLWVRAGQTPGSVEWSFGSSPFGSDVGFGTASLTNTFHNTVDLGSAGRFDVYSSSFKTTGKAAAGLYWLTLTSGWPKDGYSLYWDNNFAPTTAWASGGSDPPGQATASTFEINGDKLAATPEPSTLALLTMGGISLGGYLARRRLWAKS